MAHALPVARNEFEVMALRDANVGMAEHLRDGKDVSAVFAAAHQQINREGVAETMAGAFRDASQSQDFF